MPFPSPLLYPITATALDVVHVGVLQLQIEGAGVSQNPLYIDANSRPVAEGLIEVYFANDVSDADKAIVDAVVAAHQGKLELVFKVASTLVPAAEVPVTDDEWQILGGAVTNVAFFVPNLPQAIGRSQGVSKASGTTAGLRIVERNPVDGSEIVLAETVLPERAEMKEFAFSSNVPPRAGTMEYRLEGRLNGAASASVGFVSMTLLEAFLVGLRPAV
jgi:hypothetical protein